MLVEACEIISNLFDGELLTYVGDHFRVDSHRLWDVPEHRVPIAVAVSGEKSATRFSPLADHLIAVEPEAALAAGRRPRTRPATPSRKIGQMPVSWDADQDAAIARAHEQFRWFAGGWKVNADLPTTAGFRGGHAVRRPEDVAGTIPCGNDVDAIVEAASAYFEAGFTDLALVQIGGEHQSEFLKAAQSEIIPALREAAQGNDPSPS